MKFSRENFNRKIIATKGSPESIEGLLKCLRNAMNKSIIVNEGPNKQSLALNKR